MPRSLKWLPEALSDLARLREFIRIHNPDAARGGKADFEAVQKVQALPRLAVRLLTLSDPNCGTFFIPFGQAGYYVRYTVTDDEIIMVRIWHSRENSIVF